MSGQRLRMRFPERIGGNQAERADEPSLEHYAGTTAAAELDPAGAELVIAITRAIVACGVPALDRS